MTNDNNHWWDDVIDTITDVVDDVVDTVGDAVEVSLEWVNDQIDTFIWDASSGVAYLEDWIKSTAENYTDSVDTLSERVNDSLSGGVEYITDDVREQYLDLYDLYAQVGTTAVGDSADIIDSLLEYIEAKVSGTDTSFVDIVITQIDEVVDIITDPLDDIAKAVFRMMLDPLGNILLGMVNIVGARLENWFANAVGVEPVAPEPETPEETEE